MNCEYLKDHLDPYLDGEMKNPSLAEKIRKHLDTCPDCREDFNIQRELKLAVGRVERERPSPYLETRILAAISARNEGMSRRVTLRLSLAAAFVVVLALFVWLGVPLLKGGGGGVGEYAELAGEGGEGIIASGEITADDLIYFAVANHRAVESEMRVLRYVVDEDDDLQVIFAAAEGGVPVEEENDGQ